jgi:hypothetical protein
MRKKQRNGGGTALEEDSSTKVPIAGSPRLLFPNRFPGSTHKIIARSLVVAEVSSVAVGCASESDDAENASASGEALKSAECPKQVSVTIGAFDILPTLSF